jgi:hypothetical protein
MKLAWLCYPYEDNQEVEIAFEQPPKWKYSKVVHIVYAEIQDAT